MVILIFGEIVPKNMAMINSEKMALLYASMISGLMKLLTPLIFVIDSLAKGIMKLFRVDADKKTAMTENELRTYVEVGHEDGVIESEEREMIYNVFDFGDAVAKDVMIPRIDMVTVDKEATYEEVMEVFKDCMYTRIPVFEEDKDIFGSAVGRTIENGTSYAKVRFKSNNDRYFWCDVHFSAVYDAGGSVCCVIATAKPFDEISGGSVSDGKLNEQYDKLTGLYDGVTFCRRRSTTRSGAAHPTTSTSRFTWSAPSWLTSVRICSKCSTWRLAPTFRPRRPPLPVPPFFFRFDL